MVTEAREEELMDEALKALETAGVQTMPRGEAGVFLSSVMTLAFMLLRTVEDDSFARGWLDSARDNLEYPATVEIRKPS